MSGLKPASRAHRHKQQHTRPLDSRRHNLCFHSLRKIQDSVAFRDTCRIAQSPEHRGNALTSRRTIRLTWHCVVRYCSRFARLLSIKPRDGCEMCAPPITRGFCGAAFEVDGCFGIVGHPHALFLRRRAAARDNLKQVGKILGLHGWSRCCDGCVHREDCSTGSLRQSPTGFARGRRAFSSCAESRMGTT